MRHVAVATLAMVLGLQSALPTLGGRLQPGMQLVYGTPWTVAAVRTDSIVDGMRCLSLVLRMNPADSTRTTRLQCSDGSKMHAWSATANRLMPARPLAPGELVTRGANGGSSRYVAAAAEMDTIGGEIFVVVPTVVETFDASGKLVRRLRERFAIELATATCGVFEVPNGDGLRVEQRFALTAVVRPGEIPAATSASRPSASPPTTKC